MKIEHSDRFIFEGNCVIGDLVNACVSTKGFSVEARKEFLAEVQAIIAMASGVIAVAEVAMRKVDPYK